MGRTALLVAGLLAPLLLLIRPYTFTIRDVLMACGSGVAMGTGLGLLYYGYSTVSVGVIAPVSSVLLGVVPVAFDVLRGRGISAVAWMGIALGLAAVALVTYLPGGGGNRWAGLWLGASAGIVFGIGFTLMDVTSDAAGLSPVLVQRFAALATLTLARPLDHREWIARRGPMRAAISTGVFAFAAMGSLQLAFRYGSAGPVSVVTSQYATLAVLLAVVINGEKLRWWQAVGICAAAVGVAMLALG